MSRFLSLPKGIVDREGVACHSQVFGVDLRETFAAWVVSMNEKKVWKRPRNDIIYLLEELIEHDIVNMRRSCTVKLDYRLSVGVITVKRPKLTSCVSEQHQKVFRFTTRNFLKNFLLRVAIHHTREDAILNSIEKNTAIGFGRWLFIKSRTWRRENSYRFVCRKKLKKINFLNFFRNI